MNKLRTYKIKTITNNRKCYKGVKELKAKYKPKIYKLVDKTGRALTERNEVIEEVINYFQELAKENTIATEEKDPDNI